MPNEKRMDVRRDFARHVLPWLVAAAMLAIYAITMDHWMSLFNTDEVAAMSGWIWTPQLYNPLYFLVTLPFRILPAAVIPIALNIFSVLCGAVTLGLLTRSAGLLPHDRTEAQSARLRNDFFLLRMRGDWFPSLLAALLCGLELTYWQLATNGGNAIFDLLLFALGIWCLLEYRLDGRVWRLYLSAAITGAGVAEGPSITGMLPLYLITIIWLRGLAFFDLRFLVRMFWFGLAGFSLFLLLPLLAAVSGKGPFFELLRFSLLPQYQALKLYYTCVTNPVSYLDNPIMPLFIVLIPLLVMSVRWKFGDNSRIGSLLATLMFHVIHAVFLVVCLWLAFDPPFSPREKGFSLTLYYLIALATAYYAGYFLLIFGRRRLRERTAPPAATRLFNGVVVTAVWAVGILAVIGLFYKNTGLIWGDNGNTLESYASLLAGSLPREGAVVLSDDPHQLYLAQEALVRDGEQKKFLLLDTGLLPYPDYHRFLHQRSPQQWPLPPAAAATNGFTMPGLISVLARAGASNTLYYLQPSFGYYFEAFYLEPHGLAYQLKPLPADTLMPPAPAQGLVAWNQDFWTDAQNRLLSSVEDALAPRADESAETFGQYELEQLYVPDEPDINASVVGDWCSRSLDFWGVELQRSGNLADAADCFKQALALNTNNVVAKINFDCNFKLQAGRHPGVDASQVTADRLGKFNNIGQAINADGPFDDPNYCFQFGYVLAHDNSFFRQAAAPLERVRQFDPNFLPARLWLGEIYGLNRLPERLLDVLSPAIEHPSEFSATPADVTQMMMLMSAAYFQKNQGTKGARLLEAEVSRNATNTDLLMTIDRIYCTMRMYSNALDLANSELKRLPGNPDWLYAKGYSDNQLQRFADAIAALTKVLAVQKNNLNAVYQRGGAYLASGNLDAARADYQKLQAVQTNSVPVAFALGEIAWTRHNVPEAIRNYNIYVANAPTNTPQGKIVADRLRQLKQPASEPRP